MATIAITASPAASFNPHAAKQPDLDPTKAFYTLHPELKGLFPTTQPDIQWHPDRDAYAARTKRRMLMADLPAKLPAGWPEHIEGPEVWDGKDLTTTEEPGKANIVVHLNADNIHDLERATMHFRKNGRSPHISHIWQTNWLMDPNGTPAFVNRATFPLAERTRILLQDCTQRLYNGHGLLILRGLDPDNYAYMDNVIMYAGLTSHIGDQRGVQTQATKEVLGHITDTGFTLTRYPLASHTNEAQPFHNDLGDILCLYVLNPATEGGDSYVASTAKVYNELAATRPDLIHSLQLPWVFDTPEVEPDHYVRQLLHYHKGRVTINFARRLFTGYGAWEKRSAYLPPISEAQAEALDAIEYTALKYKVTMQLEKGDIQLQNNLATIHGRSAFADGDGDDEIRHMLRLWVRDEEIGWEIPPALRSEWKRVFDIRPEDQVWPRGPTVASVTDGGGSCS